MTLLQLVDMMYYIDWISNAKSVLYMRSKSHFIVLYNFYVLLDILSTIIFLKFLTSIFMKDIDLQFFFIFLQFNHQIGCNFVEHEHVSRNHWSAHCVSLIVVFLLATIFTTVMLARCGDTHLWSQHHGKLR